MTKSEPVSWYRIYEMFQFQSFHMYGIIMTAVVVGVIGIQIYKETMLLVWTEIPFQFQTKKKVLKIILLAEPSSDWAGE